LIILKNYSKKALKTLLITIVITAFYLGIISAYDLIEPFEPQHIKEGEIPNLGPYRTPVPKEYRCHLEAGHRYHIFLVGDWISNSSEATDYDIEVRNPNNVAISINTESAGLPEQVANDEKHQFFVPPQSGDYRFLIFNDPKDSPIGSADAADFLIIEHLDMNTVYTKNLIGKPSVGAEYPKGYKVGYEFNTTASDFLLYIKVPDPVPADGIKGLDMYEARVYPMANPENDIGYSIQGVGVPFGEMMYDGGQTALYGGYNTQIEGFRFSEMRISCESAGVDMRKVMQMEVTNATMGQNVYYYLVLLAEYFEGEVEFFLKTDYRPVNLTLIDPPEIGYTNETTLIKVETESAAEIESIWIDYTTDNWKTSKKIDLLNKQEYWLAALSSFDLHDDVEYKIHAVDEIDNRGLFEGSFTVMNKIEIDYSMSGSVIQGGQNVKITGVATRPSVNLKLNIEHNGNIESFNLQTDGEGSFTYEYKPTKIGEYDVTISYAGDEDYHSALSREKSFRVDKRKLLLSFDMDSHIKNKRPCTITGQVIPAITGLQIEFIFVSPEASFTEIVTTGREGAFSLTITPEVEGLWDVLPQLKVSELYDASQTQLVTFEVDKLTIIDTIMYKATEFTKPPLMFVPIGLSTVLVGGLVYKAKHAKEQSEEDEQEIPEEEKTEGLTSYKRRSSR